MEHTTLNDGSQGGNHRKAPHCWNWVLQILPAKTGDLMGSEGEAIQWSCSPWCIVDWLTQGPQREQADRKWNRCDQSLQWKSMWGCCRSSVPQSRLVQAWSNGSDLQIFHHSCHCWGATRTLHTSCPGNLHGHFAPFLSPRIPLLLSLVRSSDPHSTPME